MTHHHDTHTPVDDPAAARIREALPPLDDDARARIAAHVAAGEQARTRRTAAAPARRRPSSRRLVRPALVAGAAALAVGIALLAPSDDSSSPTNGMLGLGPDPAAADVLRAAGDATAQEPWRPLRAGEFHHTVEHHDEPYAAGLRTVERWITTDGSGYERESLDLSTIADGEPFYTPAQTCDAPAVGGGSAAAPAIGTTIPVDAPPLACWSDGTHYVDPALRAATGRAVAAPPDGAPVYLSPMQVTGDMTGNLHYGSNVHEGTTERDVPPSFGDDAVVPADTTWIEVEPRVVVTQEGRTTTGGLAIDMADWSDTFTMQDIANLPTTGDGMRRVLVDAARREMEEFAQAAPAPVKTPAPTDDASLETAGILLASSLLAEAPISPEVRQATFDALASSHFDRQPSTVTRGLRLPGGGDAIGVRFPLMEQPAGRSQPDAGDNVLFVLDASSGRLVSMTVTFSDHESRTSWEAPDRVDALPSPTPGSAPLPTDAARIR